MMKYVLLGHVMCFYFKYPTSKRDDYQKFSKHYSTQSLFFFSFRSNCKVAKCPLMASKEYVHPVHFKSHMQQASHSLLLYNLRSQVLNCKIIDNIFFVLTLICNAKRLKRIFSLHEISPIASFIKTNPCFPHLLIVS